VDERSARPGVRLLPPAGHRAGPARRGVARVRAPGAACRVRGLRLLARRRRGRRPGPPWAHRLGSATGQPRLLSLGANDQAARQPQSRREIGHDGQWGR
jgi:hypothetical protein